MKSKADISKKLRNLRVRYANQYVKASQARCHLNCIHNKEHVPRGKIVADPEVEYERAPRRSVTLVVLKDQGPVRLCMYGAEDPASWKGDLCESDDISAACPWFRPLVNEDDAKSEFQGLLLDDQYVYDKYRDIATLQWVLDERVANRPFSLLERITTWLELWRARRARLRTPAPPPELPEVPGDLWNDGGP